MKRYALALVLGCAGAAFMPAWADEAATEGSAPASAPAAPLPDEQYVRHNNFVIQENLDRLDINHVKFKVSNAGLAISHGGLLSAKTIEKITYSHVHAVRTSPMIRNFDWKTDFSFDSAGKDSVFGYLFLPEASEKFDRVDDEIATYVIVMLSADGKLLTRVDRALPPKVSPAQLRQISSASAKDIDAQNLTYDTVPVAGFRPNGEVNSLRIVRDERQWRIFVNDVQVRTLEVNSLAPIFLGFSPKLLIGGKTDVTLRDETLTASYLNARLRAEIAKYVPFEGKLIGRCLSPQGVPVFVGFGQKMGWPAMMLGGIGIGAPDGRPLHFSYKEQGNGSFSGSNYLDDEMVFGGRRFRISDRFFINPGEGKLSFRMLGETGYTSTTRSQEYCDLQVMKPVAK